MEIVDYVVELHYELSKLYLDKLPFEAILVLRVKKGPIVPEPYGIPEHLPVLNGVEIMFRSHAQFLARRMRMRTQPSCLSTGKG